MVRIPVAVAVGATAVPGLLPAWFVAHDLIVQDRTVVSGRVSETGAERVSTGRGASDRLLLTIEGQPYVFFRSVGWFGNRAAMLEAVEAGRDAAVEVRKEDLAAQSSFDPDARRVEIVSLTQNGTAVFTRRDLLLPQIAGASILALASLVVLALAGLLALRPGVLARDGTGSGAGARVGGEGRSAGRRRTSARKSS